MSAGPALEAPPTSTSDAPAAPGPPRQGGPRRRRLVWVVIVVVVIALTWLVTLQGASNGQARDPANPGPEGGQAVARVLEQHGVEVTVVRSQEAFLEQRVDADTSVLVTRTDQLSGGTAGTLLHHARDADRVVLLLADPTVVGGMGLPVDATQDTTYTAMTAECDTADVAAAERISRGGWLYAPRAGATASVCFPPSASFSAGGSNSGYYVDLAPTSERPRVVLLGSGQVLENSTVTEADNAAVALRSLGHSPRLVWYVADLQDIAAQDAGAAVPLLPSWSGPTLVLLGSAVVALMLWRGRRLGRLVTEPLPVVVRAIETTESRGRLYRRAGDRGRALAVLQGSTRRRLTAYLGLSPGAGLTELAHAVAAATGRPVDAVLALLAGPAPTQDALVQTADQLASLEEEVRR